MAPNLPIDLLRSLVAVADSGTLRTAAQRVHRTASALSLQMSKLEAASGLPLFERRGRTLTLTAAGEMLVAHAREILDRHDMAVSALRGAARAGRARLGLVQDFAESLLTGILARLRVLHPMAEIGIMVSGSADLRRAITAGDLDLALAVRGDGGPKPIRVDPALWLGDPRVLAQDRLPLVLLAPPCPFSEAACAALDAARRPYYVALRTPSLLGMRAAIEAGIGIGCRTRLFAAGRLPVLFDHRLPELPQVAYALWSGRRRGPAATSLAAIVEEAVASLPV